MGLTGGTKTDAADGRRRKNWGEDASGVESIANRNSSALWCAASGRGALSYAATKDEQVTMLRGSLECGAGTRDGDAGNFVQFVEETKFELCTDLDLA